MGHHKNRYRPPSPPPYRDPFPPNDGRGRDPRGYDGSQGSDPRGYPPPRRIPWIVILGALAVWTLLAWGAWSLTGPLLAWAGGLVAPMLNVGTAVGGAVGLGKEVGAVIEASRAEGLAQWLLGVVGWLAKPAIMGIWALGAGAILLARRGLNRSQLSRLLH